MPSSEKESARRERAEARRAGRATETARVAEARRKKEADKCVAEAQRESEKSRREKARAVSVQKAAEDKARQRETVWEAEYHQACTLARAPQWEHERIQEEAADPHRVAWRNRCQEWIAARRTASDTARVEIDREFSQWLGCAGAEQMHQDWRASLIVRARQERARQQKEVGGAHKAEEWFSRFITDRGIGTAREIEKASAVLHRQAQRGKKRAGQEQQSRRQRSRKNAARQDDSRPSAGSEEGGAKNRKRPLPECGSDSEAVSEGEQPAKRIAMGCAGDRHDVRPTPAVGAADHSWEGVAGAELASSPMAPEPTAAVEPDGGLAMGWHTAVLEYTEEFFKAAYP